MTMTEDLKKIAMRYAHDELKDNHALVETIVAAAFLNGIDYSEHHPHWISVEDELPKINPNGGEWEFSDDVIVSLKDGSIAVGRYERDNSTGEHYWVLCGVDKDLVVTHWMPRPAPPEHIADVSKKISSSELPNNRKGGEQ